MGNFNLNLIKGISLWQILGQSFPLCLIETGEELCEGCLDRTAVVAGQLINSSPLFNKLVQQAYIDHI